jgi:hypothetical protein
MLANSPSSQTDLRGVASRFERLNRIAHHEVCGAFAIFTLAVFASAGMALPDWYFPKDQARQQISAWLSRPRILSLINPFWVAGYLAARCFVHQTWPDLRRRVARRLPAPSV